jgi:hypothetical protein
MKGRQLEPAVPTERKVNEMTGSSNTESVGSVSSKGPEQPLQPTTEPGETQKLVDDQQPGLATAFSGSHVSPPQTHMIQMEVNQATEPSLQGNDEADTIQLEQSQQLATGDEEPPDVTMSMYPSLAYITGLDVDSNPTETDHSDADSAIGPSVYSSTFSTNSSVYDFVEENGRTYHRFKEGKYHLPNDEVSSSFDA